MEKALVRGEELQESVQEWINFMARSWRWRPGHICWGFTFSASCPWGFVGWPAIQAEYVISVCSEFSAEKGGKHKAWSTIPGCGPLGMPSVYPHHSWALPLTWGCFSLPCCWNLPSTEGLTLAILFLGSLRGYAWKPLEQHSVDERSRNGAGDVTDLPNLPDTESHVEGAASALCHFPLALTAPPPPQEAAWMLGKGWRGGREGRGRSWLEGSLTRELS